MDSTALSDEALMAAYKDQQKVERGFRFLKDPLFMASSLYLKSPERIMALMMVMTLCLLVYAALEYRIRQSLKEHRQAFPNQKGEPIANPTARWVFQFFAGIHMLVIAQVQVLVLNMNEYHTALLKLLDGAVSRRKAPTSVRRYVKFSVSAALISLWHPFWERDGKLIQGHIPVGARFLGPHSAAP